MPANAGDMGSVLNLWRFHMPLVNQFHAPQLQIPHSRACEPQRLSPDPFKLCFNCHLYHLLTLLYMSCKITFPSTFLFFIKIYTTQKKRPYYKCCIIYSMVLYTFTLVLTSYKRFFAISHKGNLYNKPPFLGNSRTFQSTP